MKFRVETWDTTERYGSYYIVAEGSTKTMGWGLRYNRVKANLPPHFMVRELVRKWWGWEFVRGGYGTKETKPMSTKQRGDVRHYPAEDADEVFRVYLDAKNGIDFDRQEFRRIWEAGNAEFNGPITATEASYRPAYGAFREVLAEKDAEIARLKAQSGGEHWAVSYMEERKETARLRGWLEKIKKHEVSYCECCNNPEDLGETTAAIWCRRALAGEKVPE